MKLRAHPRYAVYKDWFRTQAGLASRLEAELFRVAGPRRTTAEEILQGVGAFKGGGRWNPPGVMNAVYLSFEPETAGFEANENSRYFRIPLSLGMPKVTVAVRVTLDAVLDLSQIPTFPEQVADLMAEDWRAVMAKKQEATSQAVGRAAFAAGLQGLILPSKPDPKGKNVLIFPENLTGSCVLELLNPGLLARLGRIA